MPEIESRPLAELTTLRVGASPYRIIEACTAEELVATLRELWSLDEPWFVLGGGSNVLVGDEPFDGTVVLVRTSGIERVPAARDGHVRVRVQAGHSWDGFVEHAVAQGWGGIVALSGIPGTVGATPVQNVGAYGQEISETLVEVELLDEETFELVTVPADELGLGNRTSVLKHHYGSTARRPAVIVAATFELPVQGHGPAPVRGDQLRAALGVGSDEPMSLAQIRERILAIRSGKGMVLDATDPDTASAGSFFQNPIVSARFARTLPDGCPRWPLAPVPAEVTVIPLEAFDGSVPAPAAPEPDVKVSAAWLIENAGLGKGFSLPGSRASLSTKHTLALTNRGGATGAELAELARFVQRRVHAEYGIELQPEPVLVNVEL